MYEPEGIEEKGRYRGGDATQEESCEGVVTRKSYPRRGEGGERTQKEERRSTSARGRRRRSRQDEPRTLRHVDDVVEADGPLVGRAARRRRRRMPAAALDALHGPAAHGRCRERERRRRALLAAVRGTDGGDGEAAAARRVEAALLGRPGVRRRCERQEVVAVVVVRRRGRRREVDGDGLVDRRNGPSGGGANARVLGEVGRGELQ